MAKTGLKHIVAAKLDDTGATPTYTEGLIVGNGKQNRSGGYCSFQPRRSILHGRYGENLSGNKFNRTGLEFDDLPCAHDLCGRRHQRQRYDICYQRLGIQHHIGFSLY